ncbi:hypothetical protein ABTY59_11635 [Streptomyces sp. NPDC096079]|uniref:hypothetical protein n=1 Tax=Streptomyces sp. NPDC096079 TaxID=3155820 RepID=UPI003322E81C
MLTTLVVGTAGAAACGADGTATTAAPERPRTTAAATATRPAPSPTTRAVPRAADLPRHAVAGEERPAFGAAGTMAAGYTGREFLTGLSADWKLKLGEPVEQEMPDGKKKTYVNGTGGNGISISAGYADHENMSSLLCRTDANRSGDFAFLTACTRLDVTGVDHAKAASWLVQARKETDSLYEKKVAQTGNKKEYVVSGVLTSGPVVMVLHRAYGTYSLRILGGAAA